MIFYDHRQRRKIYFRLLIITFFGILVGGFVFLVVGVVNRASTGDYTLKAPTYHDYYYYSGQNDKKLVLTFDDGPNPAYTYDVMEILKKHDVPAVFFLLGNKVMRHEEVVAFMDKSGFEIGNHSFTHSLNVHQSRRRLEIELSTTEKLIRNVTGKATPFYRPPYLLDIGIDPTINPNIPESKPLRWAARVGYLPVGIDIDSRDWQVETVDEVVTNVREGARRGGHIILLHDGDGQAAERTVAALDRIITELKAEGYTFVPLTELFGINRDVHLTADLLPASTDAETDSKVSELQLFLKKADFSYLEVSGRFDEATAFAAQEWERQSGTELAHGFRVATGDRETAGQVSRLQSYLRETETPWLKITGVFDPPTEQAVKVWQLRNGVPSAELGWVGSETRQAILTASGITAPRDRSRLQRGIDGFRLHFEAGYLSFLSVFMPGFFVCLKIILLLIVFRSAFLLILFFYSLRTPGKKTYRAHAPDPWVSIIIPAYNEGENIASTILSIAGSDYPNKEIIVVNDGSKDNTAAVVERVIQQFPETVRLVTVPNGGKAKALNIGLSHAQYDIVITLDGDSIFGEGAIRALSRHFKDCSVGAVAGKVSVVDSGRLLGVFQSIEYITGQNMEKRAFAAINAISVVPGPVGAWRKDLVSKLGGFRENTLVEDQDMTLAIQAAGMRILYEPTAIAYTETPVSVRDFMKQRFRWVFGTLQCFWKYKHYLFSRKRKPLGWVILPNVILCNTLIPLFFPIVDLLSLLAIFMGNARQVGIAYLLFMVVDFFYAACAFWNEPGKRRLLLLLPLQRIFYRQIMYVIIFKSVIKAIEGTGTLWNKVKRTGLTQKFYQEKTAASVPEPVPIPTS